MGTQSIEKKEKPLIICPKKRRIYSKGSEYYYKIPSKIMEFFIFNIPQIKHLSRSFFLNDYEIGVILAKRYNHLMDVILINYILE